MTRALISGISGCVGSHLAEYLLANTDWHIVGMLRSHRSPLDNLASVIGNERVTFVTADLRDACAVNSAVETAAPDYVFHLAAESYPKESFSAPTLFYDTNIGGTERLLQAINFFAKDAKVHVCSSSEVYGKVARESVPITEVCPFHPASPYAISKVGADLIAQHYAEAYSLHVQVTRMFTHTGPRRGDVFAESSFAKQIAMIEAGQMQPPIKVGNLNSLRTVADVRDAVNAYHRLLAYNPQRGEVYNIGGNHTCTVGDILEALFRAAGTRYPFEVDLARLRPIDADLQVPDCSKFKNHTGWEPMIPFEQTMADLLAYWRGKVKAGPCLNR